MDTVIANGHLQRARAGIRQALFQWDGTDLARIDASRELLVAAVSDMRTFESAVRCGSVPATEELCETLLAVRQDIIQATRVVDSCVAFHRGLAARMGGSAPGYNAEGRMAAESPGMEPEVLA